MDTVGYLAFLKINGNTRCNYQKKRIGKTEGQFRVRVQRDCEDAAVEVGGCPTAMSSSTGDSNESFTASDILSPETWVSTRSPPAFGLDAAATKIAVDFQALRAETAERVLREQFRF